MSALARLKTYTPQLDLATQFNLPQKEAILLHPRQAHIPSPHASKLGGTIAWPQEEAWPTCDQHNFPVTPIMQLTKHDVPQLPFPSDTDTFQLLWCPEDHNTLSDDPRITTRWRNTATMGELRDHIPNFPDWRNYMYVPKECTIFPESVLETERSLSMDMALVEKMDDYIFEHGKADLNAMNLPENETFDPYLTYFSAAPGTKVGGFPFFIQDTVVPTCSCGRDMDHLLSV